jgi:hypothetical protein
MVVRENGACPRFPPLRWGFVMVIGSGCVRG